MHLDVHDLRNFYYRTNLGRVAQRAIRAQVHDLWPAGALSGLALVGFGFAVPLLRPYLGEAQRVLALMPGQQGVMPWPAASGNIAALVDETRWPLPAAAADRLIVLHGLETSENADALLEECARVLDRDGRALFIVPNRAGLWARRDRTPFGVGRPYSLGQLEAQLARHGFTAQTYRAALFSPPTSRRFWLRTAKFWERAGQSVSPRFAGGVLVVEATRGGGDLSGTPATSEERRPLRVLDALGQPAPAPAPG